MFLEGAGASGKESSSEETPGIIKPDEEPVPGAWLLPPQTCKKLGYLSQVHVLLGEKKLTHDEV